MSLTRADSTVAAELRNLGTLIDMLTALIALAAGVLGVAIGGLIQARGAQLAQLRERQLAAADDFLAGAVEVFVTLTATMEKMGTPQPGAEVEWLSQMRDATAKAREDAHAVTRRGARVELTFGRGSPVGTSAIELTRALLELTGELASEEATRGRVVRVVQAYDAAATAQGAFSQAAHSAVTRPIWRRTPKAI